MSLFNESEDHEPLFWWHGRPVYVAYLLVIIFVVSLLATSLAMATKVEHHLAGMIFQSRDVLAGKVWQVFTYGFYNPPSLWFVLDMFMLGWFGRELERHFGRRGFLKFYLAVYLLTPLLLTLIGVWWPMGLAGVTGTFALFIAFATLQPDAPFFFGIAAKWLAVVLVAINTLQSLAGHAYASLISLWATVGFAYTAVRLHQGRINLPELRFWRRGPKLRVLPDLPLTEERENVTAKSSNDMDVLLDKIACSGINSLTTKERARLEAMRTDLLKRRGN
jgi:hypothetical protein